MSPSPGNNKENVVPTILTKVAASKFYKGEAIVGSSNKNNVIIHLRDTAQSVTSTLLPLEPKDESFLDIKTVLFPDETSSLSAESDDAVEPLHFIPHTMFPRQRIYTSSPYDGFVHNLQTTLLDAGIDNVLTELNPISSNGVVESAILDLCDKAKVSGDIGHGLEAEVRLRKAAFSNNYIHILAFESVVDVFVELQMPEKATGILRLQWEYFDAGHAVSHSPVGLPTKPIAH